jgi:hypothetical protein
MSALKSYSPPGYPRNIWHLLLLISAFFATAFTIVDLMFITVAPLIISLPIAGLVVLALFCLRKAAGCVRYWALFLWLGLFLLFTGIFFTFAYSITYQLFLLLGNILLLVFFWNFGRFDRRILSLLFLIFTPLSGIMFLSETARDSTGVRLMSALTIDFIVYFVFYSLFVIMAVNSIKLLKLPGFRCLFAGFSLFLFAWLVLPVVDYFFKNNIELLFPFLFTLILISQVLVIVGASIFTRKMDPLELEKRLRKATPAKEVESVDQKV